MSECEYYQPFDTVLNFSASTIVKDSALIHLYIIYQDLTGQQPLWYFGYFDVLLKVVLLISPASTSFWRHKIASSTL